MPLFFQEETGTVIVSWNDSDGELLKTQVKELTTTSKVDDMRFQFVKDQHFDVAPARIKVYTSADQQTQLDPFVPVAPYFVGAVPGTSGATPLFFKLPDAAGSKGSFSAMWAN